MLAFAWEKVVLLVGRSRSGMVATCAILVAFSLWFCWSRGSLEEWLEMYEGSVLQTYLLMMMMMMKDFRPEFRRT